MAFAKTIDGVDVIVDDEWAWLLVSRPWHVETTGYIRAHRSVKNQQDKTYRADLLHRVILGLSDGDTTEVDHRNRNKADNRRENLRPCTASQNQAARPFPPGATSTYRGVRWEADRGRWRAGITCNWKRHYLGRFATEKAAALAYNQAATKLFGEFAVLNEV